MEDFDAREARKRAAADADADDDGWTVVKRHKVQLYTRARSTRMHCC